MSSKPNQFDSVAEAFSRKAAVYDSFQDDHENLSRMRRKVYNHLSSVMPSGGYLLELNAGTGLDAVEMVGRGFRIHATDLSAGMLAEIERKTLQEGMQGNLTFEQCSFTDLDRLTAGPFDGIYSNSGGLNCIDDLTQVTRHFPGLVKQGGRVTLVIMPRICPWELALTIKDFSVGTRRLRRGGVEANVENVSFMTYYFTVREVDKALGPRFRLIRLEGLSVFTPTADNKTFAIQHPHLYRRLVMLDDLTAAWPPFKSWGDFFVLTAEFTG